MSLYKYTKLRNLGPVHGFLIHTPDDRKLKDVNPQFIVRELNRMADSIKRLEAVVNDPHALWANWLRGDVKLPEGIGDVRQYQDRIKRLHEAGDEMIWAFCTVSSASMMTEREADALKLWNEAKEAKL